MTSATLFREGPDLDALLAELDAEHPGRVQVVNVEYGRAGGVLGFFAHRTVGVHYRLTGAGAVIGADAVADLDGGDPDEQQVEFARMLLELATAKAAERQAAVERELPAFPTAPAAREVPAFPTVPANPPGYVLPTPAPEPAPVFAAVPVAPEPVVAPVFAPVAPPAAPAPVYAPAAAAVTAPEPVFARIPAPAGFVPPEFAVGTLPAPAPAPIPAPVVEYAPPLPATRLPRPAGAHRASAEVDSPDAVWGEYALRRRLVEVGVPVEWIPDGADNAYWVVEQLSRRVPTILPTAAAPGQIVVVAGPADSVLSAARDLAARLRLDPQDVFAAGCGDAVPFDRRMEPWNAGATAAQYRTRGTCPLIVAVAVDGSGAEAAEWGRQVVRALVPDRVHVVVDAGRKSSDARRTIAALPAVHSLFVTAAARTSSPASVWELGVPIEMLDGRPATQGGWAAVLIDALAGLDES